ncbi:hypothetical protein [Rubritalea tangerina]
MPSQKPRSWKKAVSHHKLGPHFHGTSRLATSTHKANSPRKELNAL